MPVYFPGLRCSFCNLHNLADRMPPAWLWKRFEHSIEHACLLSGPLVASRWKDIDKHKAALERLTDLVQKVAIKGVECANNTEIAWDGQRCRSCACRDTERRLPTTNGSYCLPKSKIDWRTVKFVDDEPDTTILLLSLPCCCKMGRRWRFCQLSGCCSSISQLS